MKKSVRTKQVLDSVCPGYQSRSTGQRRQAVVRLVSEKQPPMCTMGGLWLVRRAHLNQH